MLRLSRTVDFILFPSYNIQRLYFYLHSCRYSSSFKQECEDVGKLSHISESDDNNLKLHDLDPSTPNTKIISNLLQDNKSVFKLNNAFKVIDLLSTWSETTDFHYNEVITQESYSKLVAILEMEARNKSPKDIVKALRSLLKIGVPSDSFLIESLEHDLLWMVRMTPIFSILLIIQFQVEYQETEKQKKVLEQALLALNMRWTEITHPRDICFCYTLFTHLSPALLDQVDDCVSKNAVNMSLIDLQKVLLALSGTQRRPKPILHTLSYYISKKTTPLSPKQVSSILYALNKLNLPDQMLLDKLATDLRDQMKEVTDPSTIRTIAFCMGQIRWRETTILELLGQWILEHINLCRPGDIAMMVITMAALSYTPAYIEEFIRVCIGRLSSQMCKKSEWVDVVWSLAVLQRATEEHFASVFDPSFLDDLDLSNIGVYLKLLNMNAVVSCNSSYNGPTFKPPFPGNLSITQSSKDSSLRNYVTKVLQKFLPAPKYLNVNINTNMGFIVDAEVIVDKQCKPLPIQEYSTSFGEVESIKSLPEDSHRLAFKIFTYRDFTIGEQSLTGKNTLAIRLLNQKGYKVVQIPHYNLNLKNTVQSIKYFEKCIKDSVKG